MDRRILVGKEKYDLVHKILIEVALNTLSAFPLQVVTLNKIAKESGYSRTTVYEHFHSSFTALLIEIFVYLQKERIKFYSSYYTEDNKQNIISMFKRFTDFMMNDYLLWTNLKAARILINENKKLSEFFLFKEFRIQAELCDVNEKQISEIISNFYELEDLMIKENEKDFKSYCDTFNKKIKKILN